MKFSKLGNSDLNISRIGLGAWAIGGKWLWGWGEQDDRQSIETIQHALDLGVNWIDTAPVYGLGHSEHVVGRAIQGLSEKPLIFTKCSFRWDAKGEVTPSLAAASVREEVENSLRRLKVDVIDLYQIHWPNPEDQIEEAWETMLALKNEGKIRHLGVSNHSVEQMQRLEQLGHVTSLQPPYSLVNRDCAESILPWCQQNQTGVICYSPMGSGILTGAMTRERIDNLPEDDWRKKADDFNEPKLSHNLRIVETLKSIAKRHEVNVAEVAIAWALHHPAVSGTIVGMRSPQQAEGVIGGGSLVLDDQDFALIEACLVNG
ncbi:aldo/keto reductase [Echinimonas agarilytica]|uniref:Aldo/keto reductase n=1 Tax=Echinimonas agarilytica TaxID=1215918 RepID=A0AA42B876_9GAMM|nr:aldo/keto reductase [Echinimonas agarilytica]MCM2680845.1 aldo/keto reductase [Echinimonas agarilytica]